MSSGFLLVLARITRLVFAFLGGSNEPNRDEAAEEQGKRQSDGQSVGHAQFDPLCDQRDAQADSE